MITVADAKKYRTAGTLSDPIIALVGIQNSHPTKIPTSMTPPDKPINSPIKSGENSSGCWRWMRNTSGRGVTAINITKNATSLFIGFLSSGYAVEYDGNKFLLPI